MKKTIRIISLLVVASILLTSCFDKETHIKVEESQIHGKWVKNATQEYWRYNTDHTGVTWDESEDISEEESNLIYEWSLNGDQLTHVFSGLQGNQAVPKVYTITAISKTGMEWKDDYGMTYQLTKAE